MLAYGLFLDAQVNPKGLLGEEGQEALAQLLVRGALHECDVVLAKETNGVWMKHDLELIGAVALEDLDGCVSITREDHEFAKNGVP